jgi:hypothetical protein
MFYVRQERIVRGRQERYFECLVSRTDFGVGGFVLRIMRLVKRSRRSFAYDVNNQLCNVVVRCRIYVGEVTSDDGTQAKATG